MKYLFVFLFLSGFITLVVYLLGSKGTGDFEKWQAYVEISFTKPYELIPACLKFECKFPHYDGTYPPGYFLLFYSLSQVLPVNNLGTFNSVKLIILFFFILTLIMLISINFLKKYPQQGFISIVLNTIVLFGSVISISINSLGLGYTDIFIYPFIIISLFLLSRNKIFLSGIFYSAAVQIKWQPLIMLPFFLIYILKYNQTKILSLKFFLIFCAGAFIPIAVQLPLNSQTIPVIFTALTQSAYNDSVFSQAMNIPWITTFFLHLFFPSKFGPLADGLNNYIFVSEEMRNLLNIPKLFFWTAYAGICLKFIVLKVKKILLFPYFLLASIVGYCTYFMLSTGVHENHLSTAVLFAMMLYIFYSRTKTRIFLFIFDIVHLINMAIFYGFTGIPIIRTVGLVDLSIPIAILTISGFIYLLYLYYSNLLPTYLNLDNA